MKYVVAKIHNFNPETECIKFESYEKAKAYLHWRWESYYNEEIANNSELNEEFCYHEDEYGRVQWADGDYTEFILMSVDEPESEFEAVWKRYL